VRCELWRRRRLGRDVVGAHRRRPRAGTGTVDVTVTTAAGTSPVDTAKDSFTYRTNLALLATASAGNTFQNLPDWAPSKVIDRNEETRWPLTLPASPNRVAVGVDKDPLDQLSQRLNSNVLRGRSSSPGLDRGAVGEARSRRHLSHLLRHTTRAPDHGLSPPPHPGPPSTSPNIRKPGVRPASAAASPSTREFAMDARLASLSDRIISLQRQLDALRAENARLRGADAETWRSHHLVERRAAAS
jgi:hypothetical protein